MWITARSCALTGQHFMVYTFCAGCATLKLRSHWLSVRLRFTLVIYWNVFSSWSSVHTTCSVRNYLTSLLSTCVDTILAKLQNTLPSFACHWIRIEWTIFSQWVKIGLFVAVWKSNTAVVWKFNMTDSSNEIFLSCLQS